MNAVPHLRFTFDEKVFLRILLPPICFEGALSIDKAAMRTYIGPILTYAILGTVMSSFLTASVMKAGGSILACSEFSDDDLWEDGCDFPNGLPWAECISFGALISSIDPVAVLAVLNELGVSAKEPLYIMIFGESLLNDGVSIVLFETVQDFFVDDVKVDPRDVVGAVLTFLAVFVGSGVAGFLIGLFSTIVFRWSDGRMKPSTEVLVFISLALLSYYLCDGWGGSGIVGIVSCGVMLDIYAKRHLSKVGKKHVVFVVETISGLMEVRRRAWKGGGG